MNKDTLVKKYAGKIELSNKEALVQVDALLDSIVEGLEEDGLVDITKVFKLEVKETAARKGRNPQSGEEIEIPAGKRVAFKAQKRLKDIVK